MSKEIRYLTVPNKKDISVYYNKGLSAFILPLEGYSIGFDVYFNIDEIKELSKKYEVYIIVNKFLHNDIDDLKKILGKVSINVFIEDLGLAEFLGKRAILYPNHIISNYESINYLVSIGYNNLVINNALTIDEINEIKSKTNANLYYFYISKNMIMYSRRQLLSNYYENYGIKFDNKTKSIVDKSTNKKLLIKEEESSTVVFYENTFIASKYLDDLKFMNLIINFNMLTNEEENIILENLYNKDLYKFIDCEFKFLENSIKYKVGDKV